MENPLILKRKVFTVAHLTDPPDDMRYWMTMTPHERLRLVETLRRINYGTRQSTARLQRIFEIAQRS